jgi:predicted Zn-dependent protease with MMP-like domain
MTWHVSKVKFGELVEQALETIPEHFQQFLEEVPLEIRDRSTAAERKKAGVGPNALLLGLYRGVSRMDRSVEQSGRIPDVIYIFQEDIERASDSEAGLIEQVRITVLHEIGHHFGMTEDDLRELGYG